MKKLMVIMIALGLSVAASSQKVIVGVHGGVGGHFYYRPYTSLVIGAYAPFYYHPVWYGYYGYPVYNNYYYRPTKLDLEIADIKNHYAEKIWSARHDKTLSGKERRQEVRELKQKRDQAIINAERNYYKQ